MTSHENQPPELTPDWQVEARPDPFADLCTQTWGRGYSCYLTQGHGGQHYDMGWDSWSNPLMMGGPSRDECLAASDDPFASSMSRDEATQLDTALDQPARVSTPLLRMALEIAERRDLPHGVTLGEN